MPAKPPRYLLREAAVDRMLEGAPPAPFLELGYGNGDMLVHLARKGFPGTGYDESVAARSAAAAALAAAGIRSVSLAPEFPTGRTFRYIFLFEVIGYLDDPAAYLAALKANLEPEGVIVFSFTNSRHAGDAEKLSGNMRCFSRAEMLDILARAGLVCRQCLNYGYPLSNMLRPLLHRHYRKAGPGEGKAGVAASGLQYRRQGYTLAGLLCNRLTLWPFSVLQHCFAGSDLGTGYVVMAAPETSDDR